jgi:hypothetical protein
MLKNKAFLESELKRDILDYYFYNEKTAPLWGGLCGCWEPSPQSSIIERVAP